MEFSLRSGTLHVKITADGGEVISLQDANNFESIRQGAPSVWKSRNPNLFPLRAN